MTDLGGSVDIDWADDTYAFRLSVTGAIELERKCEAPIATIFQRLNAGGYSVLDLRETIRLGLIGAGMAPTEALKLVRIYVDDRPLSESWTVAKIIVGGLFFGFAEEPLPGKPEAETPPTTTESPNFSMPATSTLRQRLSESAQMN